MFSLLLMEDDEIVVLGNMEVFVDLLNLIRYIATHQICLFIQTLFEMESKVYGITNNKLRVKTSTSLMFQTSYFDHLKKISYRN